jgi:hypothetical protein
VLYTYLEGLQKKVGSFRSLVDDEPGLREIR